RRSVRGGAPVATEAGAAERDVERRPGEQKQKHEHQPLHHARGAICEGHDLGHVDRIVADARLARRGHLQRAAASFIGTRHDVVHCGDWARIPVEARMQRPVVWMLGLTVWLMTCAAIAAAASPINVAVVITENANVIDFSGPWEVFQDTAQPGTEAPAFRLYTVSDTRHPVRLTGGLTLVPDYTFDDAPVPAIVVVGAQRGSPRMQRWLQSVASASSTRALMSVYTGT